MPWTADTGNETQRRRQARYRQRLAERSRPEASAVDVAVAEAVAAAVSAAAIDGSLDPRGTLARLVRDAVRRLVAAGYDRDEAKDKARRRLDRFGYYVPPVLDS